MVDINVSDVNVSTSDGTGADVKTSIMVDVNFNEMDGDGMCLLVSVRNNEDVPGT